MSNQTHLIARTLARPSTLTASTFAGMGVVALTKDVSAGICAGMTVAGLILAFEDIAQGITERIKLPANESRPSPEVRTQPAEPQP